MCLANLSQRSDPQAGVEPVGNLPAGYDRSTVLGMALSSAWQKGTAVKFADAL